MLKKVFEALKSSWNDEFNEELKKRPKSSPLKIIFPFDHHLKNYSCSDFKALSTSKLISNQDVDEVLKLVNEGQKHLLPMSITLKRCILISIIIGINFSILSFLFLLYSFKGNLPPIPLLIIIFMIGVILSFLSQILLGNFWKTSNRRKNEDMIYNVEQALVFHNNKLFNKLGYDWKLSENGAYISLNLSLHRVHGANSNGKLLMDGPIGHEDLSVIREESTIRTEGTNLNTEVRNVGETTIRMTEVIDEEEIKSEDEEKKEKNGNFIEEKEKVVEVSVKGNWDDFGDVLMSTDRKFK